MIELDEVQNAFVRLITSLGGRVCLVHPKGILLLEQPKRDLLGGRKIRAFEPKVISELPPIKTDDLMGVDCVYILAIVGELNAGDFGPSYVAEITTSVDTAIGHSWLINKASVMGKQIASEVEREGKNAFPMAVSLVEMPSRQGRPYISFAPPRDPNAEMMNNSEAKEFVDDLYGKGKK